MTTDLAAASIPDLIAAIRQRCRATTEGAVIAVGGLRVDVPAMTARWRGRCVQLRPRETDVLVALVGAFPRGLTCLELVLLIWDGAAAPGTARMYVRSLRLLLPGLVAPTTCGGARATTYRLTVDRTTVQDDRRDAG